MRFDRGRAEWSPREKFAAGIVLELGLVLVIRTRGILLALGGVGLLPNQSCREVKTLTKLQSDFEGILPPLKNNLKIWWGWWGTWAQGHREGGVVRQGLGTGTPRAGAQGRHDQGGVHHTRGSLVAAALEMLEIQS